MKVADSLKPIAKLIENAQDQQQGPIGSHKPTILCIACSDARTDPQYWFKTMVNQMFVIRTPGNVVPAYQTKVPCGVTAGIVYAIEYLKVKQCILMGHTDCGGVNHCYTTQAHASNPTMTNWMSQLSNQPQDLEETQDGLRSKALLLKSYQHLLLYPSVKSYMDEKKLNCHILLNQVNGKGLEYYDFSKSEFAPCMSDQ